MDKSEAIAQLEAVVEQEAIKDAESVAEKLEQRTGLYPHGWTPEDSGIRWLGFFIYESYDPFFSHSSLRVKVKDKKVVGHWFWRREVVDGWRPSINSARDMLSILKDAEPYG